MRYSLYHKLEQYPSILTSDTLAYQWYNSTDQDTLADLNNLEKLIWLDITAMDTSQMIDLLDRIDHILDVIAELSILDSITTSVPDSLDNVKRDSLCEVIETIQVADSIQGVVVKSTRDSIIDEAQTALDNFFPSHIYEEYLKDVYSILLDLRESNDIRPDSVGNILLDSIAGLCLGIGGPAVPIARSVILQYVDTVYNDETLCSEQAQQQYSSSGTPINNVKININPNPVLDILYITGSGGPGHFFLYDQLGRIVGSYSVDLTFGTDSISGIDVIHSGVYYWKYQSKSGKLFDSGIFIKK